jgi:hypothetical protein
MSNFLFGVAFDRLLFNALNRYLLKNSSSIETEMRSLILPLESTPEYASLEYLSLYLGADTAPSFSKLRKPAAISGTLYIPCPLLGTSQGWSSRFFGQPGESYDHDFSPVLDLFMRSRECGKSKQLSSSYSRPGYSGSRSSFRWESDLQGLKALLNMHEEPSVFVDDHKGVLGL